MRPSDEPGSVAGAPRPLGPAPSAADDALAETHAAGTSQADAAGSHYIFNGTKRLRCGYTTGSCAAMAAQAATRGLLSGSVPARVGLVTPSGLRVDADVLDADVAEGGSAARAAIRKDGGDDADSTDGMLVYARVGRAARAEGEPRVRIEGGRGIGIVRKPGLDQPVGAAAINSTPRRMIAEEVVRACDELGYDGGIDVVIYAPTGAEVGAKTFNPHMGVEGGISILGTSGIVRPMSERALVASIELEIRQKAAEGARDLVLVPGNYGADHVRELAELDGLAEVSFSNFLGEALDAAANHGFQRVLVVGHSGKLAKVAGGVMNTHSRVADCRCEIVCAHAAIAGASTACCRADHVGGHHRCLHGDSGRRGPARGRMPLAHGRHRRAHRPQGRRRLRDGRDHVLETLRGVRPHARLQRAHSRHARLGRPAARWPHAPRVACRGRTVGRRQPAPHIRERIRYGYG